MTSRPMRKTSFSSIHVEKEYYSRDNCPPYLSRFSNASGAKEDNELGAHTDAIYHDRVGDNERDISSAFQSIQMSPDSIVNYDKHPQTSMKITPIWRLKERMKTVGVGMILALNIGTDPPDANKPNPCAKLQCWIDPTSTSRAKAREKIGEQLESQYARWQLRSKLKYKRALDPTVEDVRSLCTTMRRNAKNERLLLHYNGHGVPRPTVNGEIWVFDKHHTQYIPLSISDLKKWIGKPSLIVLDCSGAGVLLPYLMSSDESSSVGDNKHGSSGNLYQNWNPGAQSSSKIQVGTSSIGINSGRNAGGLKSVLEKSSPQSKDSLNQFAKANRNINSFLPSETEHRESTASFSTKCVRDIIVLCPTSAPNELLPMNPELPADLFTSCLTTPIPVALRWFVLQNPLSCSNFNPESVDLIPGKVNDRKTPLGELNWIFTAITDAIAWNTLPSSLFMSLFRNDLLVASMFRNFLLADRIFRVLNCSPISYPALPSTCDHPLWQAWDLAVENCLSQLIRDDLLSVIPHHLIGKPDHNNEEGNVGDNRRNRVGDLQYQKQHHKDHMKSNNLENNDNMVKISSFHSHSPQSESHTGIPMVSNPARKKSNDSPSSFSSVSSPFFAEQLTAFEIWLEFAAIRMEEGGGVILVPSQKLYENNGHNHEKNSSSLICAGISHEMEPPEQLPVVLQVLLSPPHRVKALLLLRRFLDLGPSAVHLALSVGIFPYVLKLLQSPIDEYKHVLVGIWLKILEFDPSCKGDLVKDGALPHFIRHLHWGLQQNNEIVGSKVIKSSTTVDLDDAALQRTMAAAILSTICFDYPPGQAECIKKNLHISCASLLRSIELDLKNENPGINYENLTDNRATLEKHVPSQFRVWICICLGMLVKNNMSTQMEVFKLNVHILLFARLDDDASSVRAGACFALGCLCGTSVSIHSSDVNEIIPGVTDVSCNNSLNGLPILTATDGPLSFMNSRSQMMSKAENNLKPNPVEGLALHQHYNQTKISMQSPLHFSSDSNLIHSTLQPSPLQQHQQQQSQQQGNIQTSVYEDEYRLKLDLLIAARMCPISTDDACAAVRYEAVLVLASVVGKYLIAVAAVADELASSKVSHKEKSTTVSPAKTQLKHCSTEGLDSTFCDTSSDTIGTSPILIPLPEGVDTETATGFRKIWKKLRLLQHEDPHPAIAQAATSIVSVVNEHILLKIKFQQNYQMTGCSPRLGVQRPSSDQLFSGNTNSLSPIKHQRHLRSSSMASMGNSPIFSKKKKIDVPTQEIKSIAKKSLRRNQSDFHLDNGCATKNNLHSIGEDIKQNNITKSKEGEYKIEYRLPESSFFRWKFAMLKLQKKKSITDNHLMTSLDLLSAEGATQSYRQQRNLKIDKERARITNHFSILGPKQPQCLDSSKHILDGWNDEGSETAAALETEIASKKKELHLSQTSLLSCKDTPYILRFHSYENVLVSCDGSNGISIWDITSSNKISNFKNKRLDNSRMTSMLWINEMNNSQLITGCDDGSVRAWGGILEDNGRVSPKKPTLSSAFVAVPELNAGQRGSGLVIDWQQSQGRLLASGNTNLIRSWDLHAEKCTNVIESDVDCCLTTLAAAADNNLSSGLGPDIFAAGYGDGTMKVFDLRSNVCEAVCTESTNSGGSRRPRSYGTFKFSEHNDWIVSTSFMNCDKRYEIVTGSFAGDIKFWDLRMRRSLRTLDIQRRMTALACHSRIPLLATGSDDQFIKLITPDGDGIQVIRYNEKRKQRIGPISCLIFHPNKPILAAGTTDENIGIYDPKDIFYDVKDEHQSSPYLSRKNATNWK